ncbi:MAG: riboflavin synthase [Gammaproteobacteria bacterium]|nr:MAG: riboflavin synthase [Gammaproteobacteria bacterium]
MFTGIVQAVGTVALLETHASDRRLRVCAATLALDGVRCGDSVCVNGVCLTVHDLGAAHFSADVSAETLACTTFSTLRPEGKVNLETALTPLTPLGGHLVTGHVDGVGVVVDRRQVGRSVVFRIRVPSAIARYIAVKGAICVDGVSLTINAVRQTQFEVNIVPHTLEQTTMGDLRVGRRVNLEVDIIARYLERLLACGEDKPDGAKITAELLAKHGFIRNP